MLEANMKILHIDDDEGDRALVCYRLKQQNPAAEILSCDGIHAAGKHKDQGISLIVTDLSMPGIRREDVVPTLREMFPNVPITALSGYADTTDSDYAVVSKNSDWSITAAPVDMSKVFEEIERLNQKVRVLEDWQLSMKTKTGMIVVFLGLVFTFLSFVASTFWDYVKISK